MSSISSHFIILCASIAFIAMSTASMAQTAKFDLDAGNSAFNQKDYEIAIKKYNEALDKKPNYTEAEFNIANAYYRQEKMEDAVREFRRIAKNSEVDSTRAKAYHNLGNSYLQSQKLKEAIEAYKNSLRINPNDHETRYNLAVAKKLLEQNPQQQEQNQDQENQDKNEDQEKQDQERKDQDKKEDEENKDDQQKDDEEKENEDKKDGEDNKNGDENEEKDDLPF